MAEDGYAGRVPREVLRSLLGTFDYEIRFRDSEWVDCLLLKGDEAWLGQGLDQQAALDHALRLACPSSLARALLEEAIEKCEAAEARGERSPAEPGAESKIDPLETGANGEALASAPIVFEPGRLVHDEDPTDVLTLLADAPPNGSGSDPQASAVLAGVPESTPSSPSSGASRPGSRHSGRMYSAAPPLVRRDSIISSRMEPARALEELEILAERIRDSREELGLCAPERQRLAMLAWICEARAHTDASPDDSRIRDRVGTISRQLTDIGKTFWPGSVTALQLQMQPRDLPRHVLGGPTASWARAAELAERALRTHEYTDERRGFDPYGWADAPMTAPPPPDPEDQLAKLIAEIEGFGGTIAHNAVPRETDARPEAGTFLYWVRQLRWLRGSGIDPDRWARIAGRLRWWANHREAPLLAPSRELEAAYAPTRPWAIELGALAAEAPAETPQAKVGGCARTLGLDLLAGIQSATSGKRLVFVSMRRDPDLQTELKDALPSATLDWRVAEPKRLEMLSDAIQHGAYDVVLGALGFQSQGTDNLLARACRQAGVKYLRVNRGLPAVCLRALARDISGAPRAP